MSIQPDAERRGRDPEVYDAMEKLHEAVEQMHDDLDGYLNQIGMCLETLYDPERSYWRDRRGSLPSPDTLPARHLIASTVERLTNASDNAERLLRDRLQQLEQLGGDR